MKGFSLVEMLVALFVFALISTAGVALVRFTVDQQALVEARAERLGQLQRTRALLRADLSQAALRVTRDSAGARTAAAFTGRTPADPAPFMVLVRRGRSNPDALARSSLQHVEYRLAGGQLIRRVRSVPDGAALGPPQVLIDGVTTGSAAFLVRGGWRDRADAATLPQAARIDLSIAGLGRISQIFIVSGEPG